MVVWEGDMESSRDSVWRGRREEGKGRVVEVELKKISYASWYRCLLRSRRARFIFLFHSFTSS